MVINYFVSTCGIPHLCWLSDIFSLAPLSVVVCYFANHFSPGTHLTIRILQQGKTAAPTHLIVKAIRLIALLLRPYAQPVLHRAVVLRVLASVAVMVVALVVVTAD